jgi:hypothetical protein
MYSRCPEQFRRRYLEGEIIPPGTALITGSSVHKSAEKDLGHKIETGELATSEDVQAVARDYVAGHFTAGDYLLQPDEKSLGKDRVRDGTIDLAVNLATLHHAEIAPAVKPVAVERKWVLELNNFPVNLGGTIDCDEGDVIYDWKTAAKSPAVGAEHQSGQATIYSFAKRVLDGIEPTFRFGYLVKLKTPKAVIRETTRTPDDFNALLRVLERVSDAIEKGVFPYAAGQDPRPWICGQKYCGYYHTCAGVNCRTVFGVGKEQSK